MSYESVQIREAGPYGPWNPLGKTPKKREWVVYDGNSKTRSAVKRLAVIEDRKHVLGKEKNLPAGGRER